MLKKYCIITFSVIAVVLAIFPKLDTTFSNLFYVFPLDFIYKNHPVVVMIFRLVPIVTILWSGMCLVYLIYLFFQKKRIISSPAFYLLLAALMGPGLLVNYGLKEHMGRARPKHILEFGGDKAFSGPLRFSRECSANCSFTSGHAAMGYYFSAVSYIVPIPYKAITFILGTALGSVIGFGRIIQGGHFLSDVIFSGLIIFLVNHLCFLFWKNIVPTRKSKRK